MPCARGNAWSHDKALDATTKSHTGVNTMEGHRAARRMRGELASHTHARAHIYIYIVTFSYTPFTGPFGLFPKTRIISSHQLLDSIRGGAKTWTERKRVQVKRVLLTACAFFASDQMLGRIHVEHV